MIIKGARDGQRALIMQEKTRQESRRAALPAGNRNCIEQEDHIESAHCPLVSQRCSISSRL